MVTIDDIFLSPRSKLQRADRHIEELAARSNPLDPGLYEIGIERTPTHHQMIYRPKKDIPIEFAGIIGDAIGNVRAAFDHLVVRIVRAWGTVPSYPLYFPMTKYNDLPSHSGLTAMEGALPGLTSRFIAEVRGGADAHLWDFYTLNKDDKHNDFIPVVTVSNVREVNLPTAGPGSQPFRMAFVFPAQHPRIVFRSPHPLPLLNKVEVSVDLMFGERTPFDGEHVVPTLLQISRITRTALDWFEAFIRQNKGIT